MSGLIMPGSQGKVAEEQASECRDLLEESKDSATYYEYQASARYRSWHAVYELWQTHILSPARELERQVEALKQRRFELLLEVQQQKEEGREEAKPSSSEDGSREEIRRELAGIEEYIERHALLRYALRDGPGEAESSNVSMDYTNDEIAYYRDLSRRGFFTVREYFQDMETWIGRWNKEQELIAKTKMVYRAEVQQRVARPLELVHGKATSWNIAHRQMETKGLSKGEKKKLELAQRIMRENTEVRRKMKQLTLKTPEDKK
ncbi:unnamed protein product [Amoebophrya sp. A25]|nr:unnamed protein product [Amoebophrya sp. A25]|eukprot:GSA25T00010496001.1